MLASLALLSVTSGGEIALPADSYFKRFHLTVFDTPSQLVLRPGDRLAIVGDSITEQKQYSVMVETYLWACRPDLKIDTRQFGWGGETARGFIGRMDNDCLRFKPTIATTCYGMNDHQYRSYNRGIGAVYESTMGEVVKKFQAAGTRVIIGSAGTVGMIPSWASRPGTDREDLNLNLAKLRNIGVDLAVKTGSGFADVFTHMLIAGYEAKKRNGEAYMVEGRDGVHPGGAGHLVMAYAFLRSFGFDGNLGSIVVDYADKKAMGRDGQEVTAFDGTTLSIRSHRLPFCVADAEANQPDSVQSGTGLVAFDSDLNRLMLQVRNAPAKGLTMIWGETRVDLSREDLVRGVNLAVYRNNPVRLAFSALMEAVKAKQAYETKQIKQEFHAKNLRPSMDEIVRTTELGRDALVSTIKTHVRPVDHTIRFEVRS